MNKDMKKSQIVVFKLGNEEYAIDINNSKQIIDMENITPIPNTPEYIQGVMNLRGQIIPIIDLKKLLNISHNNNIKSRIITVEIKDFLVGIIVDNIKEIIWYLETDLEIAPEIKEENNDYIKGLINKENRLVVLLDIERLIWEKNKK